MIDIIAIPSVIYLVMVVYPSDGPKVTISEMPTMHVCESIGEWVVNHMPPTIYTCIESPRDE